jgi:hypothetical protein
MAGSFGLYPESPAATRRRTEERNRAKLRGGQNATRKDFNDQSSVDKLYKWIQEQMTYKQKFDYTANPDIGGRNPHGR